MYITGACPEWFWLIPLFGMVFMVGMMFFMCRRGMPSGIADKCGCGHIEDRHKPEHREDKEPPRSETPQP